MSQSKLPNGPTPPLDRDAIGTLVLDALGRALDWAADHHPDSLRGSVAGGFFSLFEEPEDLSEFLDSLEEESEVEWLLFMAHEWAIAEGPIEAPGPGEEALFLRDVVLGPDGPELEAEQRQVLQALASTPLRLARVEVIHGESLDLVDLLDGTTFSIVNMLDDSNLEVGEVLGVRPLDLGGPLPVPSPCLYAFDREVGESLGEELGVALAENPDQARLILATWISSSWLESTYGIVDDLGDDDEDDDEELDEEEGATEK